MTGRSMGQVTGVLFVVALALASTAHGAAFSNGSFELSPLDPGGFTQLNAGNNSITGWTVRAASVDYIGTFWPAADGARSIDLSGSAAGGVEQTFDTVPGMTYLVTFRLSGNPGCGAMVKGLDVGATGNATLHYTFDASVHSTSDGTWTLESYTFVAAGSSTTLFFQSTEASACGPALDDVRVTIPPVPALSPVAAAAVALLLAAVAVFALRRVSA